MQFGQQGSSLDTVADVVAGCWFGKNWLSNGRSSLATVPRIVAKSPLKPSTAWLQAGGTDVYNFNYAPESRWTLRSNGDGDYWLLGFLSPTKFRGLGV